MSVKVQIEVPKDKVADFCEKWQITELALFGSVLREDFRPDSDVDVLVTFSPEAHYGLFDIVHAQNELEAILGRKVDLVERKAVERSENYIRRKHILNSVNLSMWRDDAYLLDMFIAARKARDFSAGLTWQEFDRSDLHQHAIMKTIENVGEAARKISEETKAAYPAIPLGDIIGMRNRLIHDYFRIDLEKLWDTVQRDIPKLIPLLEPLIKPENP